MAPPDPEPEQRSAVITVGQDRAGHWLVQDDRALLEGRFVSRAAALGFARAERHAFSGATIALATAPLVPLVPFAPVQAWETAQTCQAFGPSASAVFGGGSSPA
ncbi:hypothetical protein [Sphingomonas sp. PAMC 26605]|uniref:hypothetical protein n=1 Tax=Sphingomonas sp. PAMC 26605 TaxID=1112214 RepID=UPI00026CABB7|nr:hypothetical protein [Sphingomonas sp. PAMC 26605]